MNNGEKVSPAPDGLANDKHFSFELRGSVIIAPEWVRPGKPTNPVKLVLD